VLPIGRFFVFYLVCIIFYVALRYFVPLPDAVAAHFGYYSTSLKSAVFNSTVHVLSVFALIVVVLAERKHGLRELIADARGKELVFIYNMNLLSLLFIPLYFESEIFVRLLRFVLFFNVMHCVSALFVWRKTYFFILTYLLFMVAYLVLFFLYPVAEYSVVPLFRNNLLLEG